MEHMRVKAVVNLENAIYNMNSMYGNLPEGTKMLAVIKTDGYGHGAVKLAARLEELPYLTGFAVATAEEAMELRRSGITKMILILGYTFEESYPDLIANDIRPAVFTFEMAKQLSDEAVKQGKTALFHIKVDTGMSRIGITPDEKGAELTESIASLPNVKLEGIFTHFAKADMIGEEPTREQIERFDHVIGLLKQRGINFEIEHCCNSAGIILYPEAAHDMVRAGITLYGLWPSEEVSKDIIDLKPLLELKSHIAYIKKIEPGRGVSYGGTYVADSERIVATVPVGYGDGYPRALSGKGYVLIRGQRAPILGRVCMDQFMVDVTDIPGVSALDEVTLIGRDGEEEITMELLGALSGRFNYELACDLGKRIPRVYI